jgi:hypothetical protein
LSAPVANDTLQSQDSTVKKGLRRSRLSAIILSSRPWALILIAAPFSSRLSRYIALDIGYRDGKTNLAHRARPLVAFAVPLFVSPLFQEFDGAAAEYHRQSRPAVHWLNKRQRSYITDNVLHAIEARLVECGEPVRLLGQKKDSGEEGFAGRGYIESATSNKDMDVSVPYEGSGPLSRAQEHLLQGLYTLLPSAGTAARIFGR